MANLFTNVEGLHPRHHAFSAFTYRNDFTAHMGVNIPCYMQEVMPNTRIKVSASALVRLQALIAPVMDNIDYYTHFWKLPYRLLENDRFTAFISSEIPDAEYDALFCTCYEIASEVVDKIGDDFDHGIEIYNMIFGNGSLMDFLGYDSTLFPTLSQVQGEDEWSLDGGNDSTKLNWRGFLAYYMLHVNWYMNENVPYFVNFVELVDQFVKEQSLSAFASLLVRSARMYGIDTVTDMLPHGWPKDYFTSGLPNVQFGDPVRLPLAGSAPVTIPANPANNLDLGPLTSSVGIVFGFEDKLNPAVLSNLYVQPDLASNNSQVYDSSTDSSLKHIFTTLRTDLNGNADLSEASAISINELRFANALQVFKERQMRFGRRRLEYYKGFFDVSPEDLRLQVPKYLGGGRIPINIADIEQTSQTEGSQALGHLAGKATAVAGGFAGFSTFCSEETVIIGISFAMPRTTYANHLSRFKLKTNDRYDYYNPSFQHLGEQSIKNIEVFAGTDNPDGDFAYTPRFAEYRFHLNEMHGEFKDSLSFWSLGRIFDSTPALNAKFIYMQPHVFDRIFAVAGQPSMIVSMLFRSRVVQPISRYGTPMLLA